MDLVSQLIQRNSAAWADSSALLWINPPADDGCLCLSSDESKPVLFSQYHGPFRHFEAMGANVRYGAFPEFASGQFSDIILTQPRSRERLVMMLHQASKKLAAGGRLWLAGENRGGIKSCKRHLAGFFHNVVKHDAARHCVLFCATDPLKGNPFFEPDYVTNWDLAAKDNGSGLIIHSLPGVFAHGHLDPGSAMLLEAIGQPRPGNRVLDFGCGCGLLGATLLKREPTLKLTLLDSDAMALRAAELTLAGNQLDAQLLPSNGFDQVGEVFDLIVSNPPFHQGVRSDSTLVPRLFERLSGQLTKNGRLILVANRHLPYHAWLKSRFRHSTILQADNRYQVIEASVPRTGN